MSVSVDSSARSRKSALYLPASNARAMEKVRTLPCNVVILDLEDAVPPESKALAREQAAAAVRAAQFGDKEVVVRVNSLETEWGRQDIQAMVITAPHAILVPKINSARDIGTYQTSLEANKHVQLWAMAETAQAFLNLREIALAARDTSLSCLVIGTNDLALELGITLTPSRTSILSHLSMAVLAARAVGLCVLDGVFNEIDDDVGFELQCRQGREFGFDGKTLIHPRQIDVCNTSFAPSRAEVEWARRVVEAFEQASNAARGVIKLDGKMVERLHLIHSRRILSAAGAGNT